MEYVANNSANTASTSGQWYAASIKNTKSTFSWWRIISLNQILGMRWTKHFAMSGMIVTSSFLFYFSRLITRTVYPYVALSGMYAVQFVHLHVLTFLFPCCDVLYDFRFSIRLFSCLCCRHLCFIYGIWSYAD